MQDYLAAQACVENIAGLSDVVYVGIKSELSTPLTLTENVYSTPAFASGKGLYKFNCKSEGQQIQGSSQGKRGGFQLTFDFALEAVDPETSKIARALNNLDVFFIVVDGDNSQIMYDPNRNVTFESDGLKSDSGKAVGDERVTTGTATLKGVKYPNLFVTAPASGGWDSLLHDAE